MVFVDGHHFRLGIGIVFFSILHDKLSVDMDVRKLRMCLLAEISLQSDPYSISES